jgi:hypothetical protein
VDFVERGYTRFCNRNGAREARSIWKGNLRIVDTLFETDVPSDSLFLVGDYEQAASIPIGATLPFLEREHPQLASAFYTVLVHSLYRWMRVYDYTDALIHAEMMTDGVTEEEIKDSYLSEIAKSVPRCLPSSEHLVKPRTLSRAVAFLKGSCEKFKGTIARKLVNEVLSLQQECRGYRHPWAAELANEVPGLDHFLSDADGCGPGCAITWYEDDCISAAFDDEMQFIGQNGPIEPSILLRIKLESDPDELDKNVQRTFDFVGAMLRSLRIASGIVEQIRGVYDEYLRGHRQNSRLQAVTGAAGLRQE